MADVKLVFSGDANKLAGELAKIFQQNERLAKQAEESKKAQAAASARNKKEREEQRAISKEFATLNKQVAAHRKLVESLKSPTDRWIKGMSQVAQLQQRGMISDREALEMERALTRTMEQQNEALRRNSSAYQQNLRMQERSREIIRGLLTPHQRYQQQLRETERLHRSGMLTADQYNRRLAQLRTGMRGASMGGRMGEAITAGLGAAGIPIAGVGVAAGGTAALVAAVQGIRGTIERMDARQQKAMEATMSMGAAMQEAAKNMSDLKPEQINQMFEFARGLNFSDPRQAVLALGRAYSASGGDRAVAQSATEIAAGLTINTPDELANVAAALVDVSKALETNAKEGAGFLLSAGTFARVEDPTKMARSLAPALVQAVNMIGGDRGQRTEAATQAAVVFDQLSLMAAEFKGESTRTATIQFLQQLDKFYDQLPDEIAEVQKEVTKLADALPVTKDELNRISQARFEMEGRRAEFEFAERTPLGPDAPEFAKRGREQLRLNMERAEIDYQKALDDSTLTEDQKKQLEVLQAQLAELKNLSDPNTVFGRMRQIGGSQAARDIFFGTDFGERQYQVGFQKLIDQIDTLLAEQIKRAEENIVPDAGVTNKILEGQNSLNEVIAQSTSARVLEGQSIENVIDALDSFNGAIKKSTEEALNANNVRVRGVGSWLMNWSEWVNQSTGMRGRQELRRQGVGGSWNPLTGIWETRLAPQATDDPVTMARTAFAELRGRAETLAFVDQQANQAKIDNLIETIDKQAEALERLINTTLADDQEQSDRARRVLHTMELYLQQNQASNAAGAIAP